MVQRRNTSKDTKARSRFYNSKENHPDFALSKEFRACFKKHPYESERIANKYAAEMSERMGYGIRTYKCEHCKKWHLTSKGV